MKEHWRIYNQYLYKMKKIYLIFFIAIITNATIAQTLKSGNYSSSDMGYTYTVIIKHEGNVITNTEPNRTNQYKSNGGNMYYHIEQNYSHFYLKVISDSKFYAGKQGGSQQLFTYQGDNVVEEEVLPSGVDDCPLYDKYLNLSQTDHKDAQAWVFCGAAAMAKCTYTSNLMVYLKPLILGLKAIVEDTSQCPCTDVITQSEWNATTD